MYRKLSYLSTAIVGLLLLFLGGFVFYLVQPLNDDIELPLKWDDGNNVSMESAINHVLNSLTIPNEYIPDFKSKYKYYLKKKEDSSVIYLVFVPDAKRLYVIENII